MYNFCEVAQFAAIKKGGAIIRGGAIFRGNTVLQTTEQMTPSKISECYTFEHLDYVQHM